MAGSSSPWLTPLLAARTQGSRDNLRHISLGPNKLISLVVPLFSLNSSTSSSTSWVAAAALSALSALSDTALSATTRVKALILSIILQISAELLCGSR
eukprot:g44938.t1